MKEEYRRQSNPFSVFTHKTQIKNNEVGHNSLNQDLIKADNARAKDMFTFPGNRQKAELHQHVSKYGYRSPAPEAVKERSCHCCGQTINIEQVKICSSPTPLKDELEQMFPQSREITSDTILFFHFIKMTIIYLLLRILFCFGFKFLANSHSHYCQSNPQNCSFQGLFLLSLWSQTRFTNYQLLQIQSLLNVLYLILAMIFFVYYRCVQHSFYTNQHAKKYTQQDFTIMVENINFFPFLQHQSHQSNDKMPQYYELMRLSQQTMNSSEVIHSSNPNIIISEALRLFFNKQANKWRMKVEKKGSQDPEALGDIELNFFDKLKSLFADNLNRPVKSVNLCFDMGDLEKVKLLRQKIIKQFQDNYTNSAYVDETSKNYPPNHVLLLAEKEIQIQKHYATTANPELSLSHFLGTAFISFEYEQYKDFFLKEHPENLKLLYDDQTCLKISQAPAVQDINWFRMQEKRQHIVGSIVKGIVFTFLALTVMITFAWWVEHLWVKAGFSLLQNDSTKRFEVTKEGIIYLLVLSFFLKFFASLLGGIINCVIESSGLKSKNSELNAKLIQKISFYTLLTVVYLVILSEFWNGDSKGWDSVTVAIVFLLVKGLVIRTLFNLINVTRLKQILVNKCWYSGDTSNVFQIQLNKLLQYPTFDISERCAFYIVWTMVGSFFFSVAWISAPLLFIMFIVNYWIDKVNLLKRSSSPTSIDKKTGYMILMILELDLIVFALGNYLSMYLATVPTFSARNTQSDLNRLFHLHLDHTQIGAIGLAMVSVFWLATYLLPQASCRDCKNKIKSYSEAEPFFHYKYWKENPASRLAEEGKYELAKNQREQKMAQIQHKNYSLPLIEINPDLEPKKQPEKKKENQNNPNLHLNLQEIDLSKAYNLKKNQQNSGSRSARKRRPIN